jgi:hypothetical protein
MTLFQMNFLKLSLVLSALLFTHNTYSLCTSDNEKAPEFNTFYIGLGFGEHHAYSEDSYYLDDEELKSDGMHLTLGCLEHLKDNVNLFLEASIIDVDRRYIGYNKESRSLWVTSGLKVDLKNKIINFSFIPQAGLTSSSQLILGGGLLFPITKELSLRADVKLVGVLNTASQFTLIYSL